MVLTVASLHIHPIKSLGGFSVAEARTTDRGFEHDRRWMLVDGNDRFLSQREVPVMACLHCAPLDGGFRVMDTRDGSDLELPWSTSEGRAAQVTVWNDTVSVIMAHADLSAWFARRLGVACSLVHMPDDSVRAVDPTYANGIVSLSDGFPYLIISEASLNDLNARFPDPLPMDRFRPSLVIAGGEAFQEDAWKDITIGTARFSLVKPCARCVITTTDQRTGVRGAEPLRTLATYRRGAGWTGGQGVHFGMNAMGQAGVLIRKGDPVRP